MIAIKGAFDGLELGESSQVANLAMFPLVRPVETEPGYLTLDEALHQGWVRVMEVSEGGSVPQLRVLNHGPRPVLIMDGEELVGAKQNRTVNLTILVPAKAEVEIPVTCVEAGRWRYRSRHFAAAPRAHYATGRAMKARQVTDNLLSLGERYADQCAVWDDIAGKSARLGARSETSAMDAMYEQAAADLADVAEKLAPSEGQCGAVFTINGAVVGMDLFDAAATFRKLLPKLAHSYGLDALDRRAAGAVHAKADVRKFLQAVAEADWQEFAAIGLGQDLRLEGQALAGGALVANGSVVHISAFQW